MSVLAADAKDGTYDDAKSSAAKQAEFLGGDAMFSSSIKLCISSDSSIASGLSQRCVKSLLTILIRLQHIQRKQQEGVSAQHQLSESGNRYAQSDDDEVFTAQPVFEGR
jgi:hypothetical protein